MPAPPLATVTLSHPSIPPIPAEPRPATFTCFNNSCQASSETTPPSRRTPPSAHMFLGINNERCVAGSQPSLPHAPGPFVIKWVASEHLRVGCDAATVQRGCGHPRPRLGRPVAPPGASASPRAEKEQARRRLAGDAPRRATRRNAKPGKAPQLPTASVRLAPVLHCCSESNRPNTIVPRSIVIPHRSRGPGRAE